MRCARNHLRRVLHLRAWLLLLCGIALAMPPAAAQTSPPPAVAPHPDLEPQDVVRIQLEALRGNSADDSGIAVAFRFASPDNRRQTGPLARFAHMIKNGAYAPMLGFTDVVYAPAIVRGRLAVQDVTLVAPGKAPVRYRFHLARQQAQGPLHECWMTEGVQVLPAQGTQV